MYLKAFFGIYFSKLFKPRVYMPKAFLFQFKVDMGRSYEDGNIVYRQSFGNFFIQTMGY